MNSVSIIGFLREKIDNIYRYFEYELNYDNEINSPRTLIVVRYWEDQENTRLLVLPNNTRIALQGHLDAHEKFGTILVVELFQLLR